jgi:hypothetical protein
LHAADLAYKPPRWVNTHPDLTALPKGTLAWRYYQAFVWHVFEHDAWGQVPRPLTIEWDRRGLSASIRNPNELRIIWPPFLLYNILHMHYLSDAPVLYYVQGSTSDRLIYGPLTFYDDYRGPATTYFRGLCWSMFEEEHRKSFKHPEPVWD